MGRFIRALSVAAAASALLLSTAATAGLIDRQSYTTDTVSGLDWLDLTATQGQSINDAAASSFAAQGWRIATYAQVLDLYSRNLGTPHQFYTTTSYDLALSMARMLGIGFSTNSDEGAFVVNDPGLPVQLQVSGFFEDGYVDEFGNSGFGQSSLAVLVDSADFPSPMGNMSAWLAYPRYVRSDYRYDYGGVYMVRSAGLEVSEPGTLALVVGCLLALAPAMRRHYSRSTKFGR